MAHVQVSCTINGCGKKCTGNKYSIDRHIQNQHIDGKKKGPHGIAAGGMAAYCKPLPEAPPPPPPDDVTAADAIKEARMAASALLFALGLSANAIASIDGALLDALLAAKGAESGRTILRADSGSLDTVVRDRLLPYLKSLITGKHVVLSVDKKDQDMAEGKGLIHVMISCAQLKASILAEAIVVPIGTSCDADYYEKLVQRVMREWGIERKYIIGISVDNTAVNPSFVRKLGFRLLPCVMHVIHLMYDACDDVFNLTALLGWREYFSRSHKRRDAAVRANVNYRATQIPGTRFGSSSTLMELLADPATFKRYLDFVETNPVAAYVKAKNKEKKAAAPPGGAAKKRRATTDNDSNATAGVAAAAAASGSSRKSFGNADAAQAQEALAYSVLLDNMRDTYTQAVVCVVHDIMKDAKPLLLASQLSSRRLPFDFWSSWDNWDQYRTLWFNSTDTMVAMLLQSKGIKLDAGGTTQLVTAVTYALEKMDDKINNHIMEWEVRACGKGAGGGRAGGR